MFAMLKIRLQRVGRVHEPVFRIVVTESQNSTKSGRYLEVLGSFDQRHDDKQLIDAERAKYWISKGAQPTGRIHNFLISKKIIEGKKINVLPKKTPIKKEAPKEEVKKTEAAAPADAPKTA